MIMSEFTCRCVRMTAHSVIRVRGRACELNVFGARYLRRLYKRDACICRSSLLHSEKLRSYGLSSIFNIIMILFVPDCGGMWRFCRVCLVYVYAVVTKGITSGSMLTECMQAC